MLTRRDFGKAAVAALPLPALFAKVNSTIHGVMIGAQTYSFRDRSLDAAIEGCLDAGLGFCELWDGHVEPQNISREEQRKWRLSIPLDEFRKVRKKFDDAGIVLYAYNYSFRKDYTDEEIARGFEMAKALGVKAITASANVSVVPRVDKYASQAKIRVGVHNHSNMRPDEFARPEDFAEAMRGRSPYIGINLDVGHFFAAGYDPVSFLEKHHKDIVTMHLKDRLKNDGAVVPFGEGQTPVKEVLQLVKKNKYPIPGMIEYEYEGKDTIAEMKRCFGWCKNALA